MTSDPEVRSVPASVARGASGFYCLLDFSIQLLLAGVGKLQLNCQRRFDQDLTCRFIFFCTSVGQLHTAPDQELNISKKMTTERKFELFPYLLIIFPLWAPRKAIYHQYSGFYHCVLLTVEKIHCKGRIWLWWKNSLYVPCAI
jgi:hypothetical protein